MDPKVSTHPLQWPLWFCRGLIVEPKATPHVSPFAFGAQRTSIIVYLGTSQNTKWKAKLVEEGEITSHKKSEVQRGAVRLLNRIKKSPA